MDLCIDSAFTSLNSTNTDDGSVEGGSDRTAETEEEWLGDAWRFAVGLTGGYRDAEDLVQEAAMRLYRKYGRLPHRGSLFTAVRNVFYDQLRRKKVVSFQSLDDPDSNLPEPASRDNGRGGGNADLETLLRSLAPKEREVVFLHYVSGYTAAEIGVLTDQPRNSVLSLLRRARQKLEPLVTS